MKEYMVVSQSLMKNRLKGIVTNRDLRFEKNNARPIEDDVKLVAGELHSEQAGFPRHKIEKLPVINKDGKLVGLLLLETSLN
jgi:IMP dehydrogenase